MTRAALGVPAAILAAAILAFGAERLYDRSGEAADFTLTSSLDRLMGGAKEAIGGSLFVKADTYFHGGTEHLGEESEADLRKEGIIGGGREEKPSDWIAAINASVKSHEHRHLREEELKEMLPFFAMATMLDPHNMEAVLTTAYWLDRHLKKPDSAIYALINGVKNNPDAWEPEYQLGLIYFKEKKDIAEALSHFQAALKKSESGDLMRHERVDIYYYLGESLRLSGRPEEAVEFYKKAFSLYAPEETSVLKSDIQSKRALLEAPVKV